MSKYSKNDTVSWQWNGSTTNATVKQVFTERVEKTIKGSTITRNATSDNPAYLVEQDDGSQAIKLESELQ